MELVIHSFFHALEDTAKLIPFLFLTYLAMEFLEHKAGEKSVRYMAKAGSKGPLLGGLFGVIPQCGFSAVAANLYAGGVISVGTLMAVFLSTSDEMLPILLSSKADAGTIVGILALKLVVGVVAGFLIDVATRRTKEEERLHIHDICEHEHCNCHGGNIWKSALHHCLQMAGFIFFMLFVIHFLTDVIGLEKILSLTLDYPIICILVAGLLGMIPGCASSVAITTLYLSGVLPFGAMLAGLLCCSGVGLMILFRVNQNLRMNLKFTAGLYGIGVFCGMIAQYFWR